MHDFASALPSSKAAPGRLPLSTYKQAFDNCPDYVTISRLSDGVYLDVNPGFEEFTGYRRDEVVGRSALELGVWPDPEERARYMKLLLAAAPGKCVAYPSYLARRTGERRAVEFAGSIMELDGEKVIIVVVRDVTERREAEAQLASYREHLESMVRQRTADLEAAHEELRAAYQKLMESERTAHFLAYHDSLTGLPNRALLMDRLTQALHLAERQRNHVHLLFLDLNGFKKVNDSLGHRAGDTLLKTIADRLKHDVRKADTVARLGGDEFVVMLTGKLLPGDVAHIACKVRESIKCPVELEGKLINVDTSIGIASYPADADEAGRLLQAADAAMYSAKRSHGNAFITFASPSQSV